MLGVHHSFLCHFFTSPLKLDQIRTDTTKIRLLWSLPLKLSICVHRKTMQPLVYNHGIIEWFGLEGIL